MTLSKKTGDRSLPATLINGHSFESVALAEFFEWDALTDSLRYSPGAALIFGGSSAVPKSGETLFNRIAKSDRARLQQSRRNLTPNAPTYVVRFSLSNSDDWLEERGCAFFDGDTQPTRIIGTLAKIVPPDESTEKKSYSFIILETLEAGFWVADCEGNFLEVNDIYCQMSGYCRDELIGRAISEFMTCEDDPGIIAHLRLIHENGNGQFEALHRHHNGNAFYTEVRATWQDINNGCIVALCWDISARKAMEQRLRENEERLRLALHGAKAGVWSLDLHTGVAVWSQENFNLYGIDSQQGAPNYEQWKNCLHPDDRSIVEKAIRSSLTQRSSEQRVGKNNSTPIFERRAPEYRVEYRILHPEYGMRWLLGIGRIERDSDGTPLRISGLNLDITERKRVEEALMDSERCWRELAEAMPQLVWTANNEGMVDYYNRRHEEFSDPHPHTIIPWHPVLHPEDRWRTTEAWRRAVQYGTPYEIEHRVQRADGSFRWYLTRAVPVRNPHGQVVKWYGTSTDVDARRQAEEALRAADRRKDEFLAMLAHELRNPLAPIRNAVHIMSILDLQDPKLKWVREVIERQVRHLTRLVDDLLDISRIVRDMITLRKERIELSRLIHQVQETTRQLIDGRKHRFVVSLPPYPVIFEGDMVRLAQVLQNLIDNAAKYTKEGGVIELSATVMRRELVITVHDNGMGITPDLLPHVFDLFQQGERTLDRAQGGLGLGLTLVRQLVKLHGGQVSAHSDGPNHGSTFTIHLPLSESEALNPEEPVPDRLVNYAQSGVRVLVVEDDVAVAESTVLWLTMEGYETRVVHTGEAALEQAPKFHPQIVLLDIGLPGMDGYATARRLRAMDNGAELYLVAVTGYGNEEAQTRSRQAGFDYHLVKPVDPKVLGGLLSALCGELTDNNLFINTR